MNYLDMWNMEESTLHATHELQPKTSSDHGAAAISEVNLHLVAGHVWCVGHVGSRNYTNGINNNK